MSNFSSYNYISIFIIGLDAVYVRLGLNLFFLAHSWMNSRFNSVWKSRVFFLHLYPSYRQFWRKIFNSQIGAQKRIFSLYFGTFCSANPIIEVWNYKISGTKVTVYSLYIVSTLANWTILWENFSSTLNKFVQRGPSQKLSPKTLWGVS